MLPSRIRALGSALTETASSAWGVLSDPTRRDGLRRVPELYAEAMRGGVTVETRQPMEGGDLRLRSIVQFDGDMTTTVAWPCNGGNAPWPKPEDAKSAIDLHHRAVLLETQPLLDAARLAVATIVSAASVLAAVPAVLEVFVVEAKSFLAWSSVVLLSWLIWTAVERLLRSCFESWIGTKQQQVFDALNGEGDSARSEDKDQEDFGKRPPLLQDMGTVTGRYAPS